MACWEDDDGKLHEMPTMQSDAQERCYNAGWSDMRAMAMNVCENAGRHDLAGYIRDLEKPAIGDK